MTHDITYMYIYLAAAPETLPCREKEHKEIKAFLRHAICRGGTGDGLYLSGMPGTGQLLGLLGLLELFEEEQETDSISLASVIRVI